MQLRSFFRSVSIRWLFLIVPLYLSGGCATFNMYPTVQSLVTVEASPGSVEIDLYSTVLIVADMQNAYLMPGGPFEQNGNDMSTVPIVIDNNIKLVNAARTAGVKVVFLKMKQMTRLMEMQQINGSSEIANWYTAIIDQLQPQRGETVIEKSSYSGFDGTHLDEILKKNKVRTIIIAGVAANVCVESTIRDAHANGYFPILVSDGTVSVGPPVTLQATIWNTEYFFGRVTKTNDILNILIRKDTDAKEPSLATIGYN